VSLHAAPPFQGRPEATASIASRSCATDTNCVPIYNVTSELKRDIGRKSPFSTRTTFDVPVMGSRRISSITFGKEKLEWRSYQILAGGDKRLRIRPVVSTKYRRVTDMTDRRTDGQTFSHGTIGAYTEHRAENEFSVRKCGVF